MNTTVSLPTDGFAVVDLRGEQLTIREVESILEELNELELRHVLVQVAESGELSPLARVLVLGLEASSSAYGLRVEVSVRLQPNRDLFDRGPANRSSSVVDIR
jgi:hypothetical protein